jgi:hypothetical protein
MVCVGVGVLVIDGVILGDKPEVGVIVGVLVIDGVILGDKPEVGVGVGDGLIGSQLLFITLFPSLQSKTILRQSSSKYIAIVLC